MTGGPEIRHNEQARRFEAGAAPSLAHLDYRVRGSSVEMLPTEVAEDLQGRGVASRLAEAALEWASEAGLRVIPSCPFVGDYIRKNPRLAGLL